MGQEFLIDMVSLNFWNLQTYQPGVRSYAHLQEGDLEPREKGPWLFF